LLRQHFIPAGCDLYFLGVQEAASEKIFVHVESLLSLEGVRRVRLEEECARSFQIEGDAGHDVPDKSSKSSDLEKRESRAPRVDGRGDGSLLSHKFTGLAVFVSERLRKRGFRVISTGSRGLDRFSSKGAAGVSVAIANGAGTAVTLAFLSSHLEAGDKSEARKQQYRDLSEKISGLLCAPGLEMTTQFHHVVWVGDMNYRCVEADGGPLMKPDAVLKALECGEVRKLYDDHDGLNVARKAEDVFYRYREAEPFPDFLPTYKLYEDREVANPTKQGWARQHFCTRYKEPFYKGGHVKDRTPGFCDRILFHSQVDRYPYLEPETVEAPLEVLHEQTDGGGFARTPLRTRLHNYQAVSGGAGFSSSDHAPVFATFRLRLLGGTAAHSQESLPRFFSQQTVSSSRSELPGRVASSASQQAMNSARSEMPGCLASTTSFLSELQPVEASSFEQSAVSPSLDRIQSPRVPLTEAESPLAMVFGEGPIAICISGLRMCWGNSSSDSMCPVGAEVNFPAPWEAESDPSGAPTVDVLPSSGWGWQGAANGDFSSSGSLRSTLAPSIAQEEASTKDALPELVLAWRGAGGAAALSHLHLVVRVLLPNHLGVECSRARGDDREAQLVSQATFALAQLLPSAIEQSGEIRARSPRYWSEGDSEASENEDLNAFVDLDRPMQKDDVIADLCEPLIRQGMPEHILKNGERQHCKLACKFRIKGVKPAELAKRMQLTQCKLLGAEPTMRRQKR
jgi:hypothetical protein